MTKAIRRAREEAAEAGLETYVGRDCHRNHGGERYVEKHGGSCVSCYDEHKKAMKARHHRTYMDRSKKNRELWMWRRARARASARGIPFSISVEDIKIPTRCPVLGFPLQTTKVGKKGSYRARPTLDRRINELGYVPGNVFVISHKANTLKSDATEQELEAILRYVRGW